MNEPKTNTYTVDEIHKMRLAVAERYRGMSLDEAERDFKAHVENAKKTMEVLRNKRRVSAF